MRHQTCRQDAVRSALENVLLDRGRCEDVILDRAATSGKAIAPRTDADGNSDRDLGVEPLFRCLIARCRIRSSPCGLTLSDDLILVFEMGWMSGTATRPITSTATAKREREQEHLGGLAPDELNAAEDAEDGDRARERATHSFRGCRDCLGRLDDAGQHQDDGRGSAQSADDGDVQRGPLRTAAAAAGPGRLRGRRAGRSLDRCRRSGQIDIPWGTPLPQ